MWAHVNDSLETESRDKGNQRGFHLHGLQFRSTLSSGAQGEKSVMAAVLALVFPILLYCKYNRCKVQDFSPDEVVEVFLAHAHGLDSWALVNQRSLDSDLGDVDTKYYTDFCHHRICRVDWDLLGYLAGIPFAIPEGSRKLSIDPMSYLPVLWGLVLLKVLEYPRCPVLFKFVMWFMKKRSTICKDPRISCLPKWNRTTTGAGPVKFCFCQQYKLTNLKNLNYGDEVNNAIKIHISISLSIEEQKKKSRSVRGYKWGAKGEPFSGLALIEVCCPEEHEQGEQNCSGNNRVQTVATWLLCN